jgi:hypothetical protein
LNIEVYVVFVLISDHGHARNKFSISVYLVVIDLDGSAKGHNTVKFTASNNI